MTTRPTARSIAGSEQGAALVMTLLVLVLLTAFGLTLVALGMTEVAISTNWRDYTKDLYAAEAGLESGVVSLRNLLNTTPSPTTAQLNGIGGTANTPAFTSIAGVSFNTYSITTAAPAYLTTFAAGPYVGLYGTVTDYTITAQVAGQGGTTSNLNRVLSYTSVPLFQFGVFYGAGVDLEWDPGANMTFNGRIHSNSNIYIASQATLQVNSYLTTAGGIYRTLKRDNAPNCNPCSGSQQPYPPTSYTADYNDPQIKGADGSYHALNFDSNYQPGWAGKWASPSAWASQAQSTFGGMVKDSAMGVGRSPRRSPASSTARRIPTSSPTR
jgi:Tfp pilus assembly protein PilX